MKKYIVILEYKETKGESVLSWSVNGKSKPIPKEIKRTIAQDYLNELLDRHRIDIERRKYGITS